MDFMVSIMVFFCSVEVLWKNAYARRRAETKNSKYEKKFYLPDFPKQWLNDNYRVPSDQMCADILKPADQYFLLPWWYHYCQKLQEAKARTLKNSFFTNMPLFKTVLERVKKFKKKGKQNPVEVPAYRDFDTGPRKHLAIYRPMARRYLHINRGRQFRFLEHQ